MNPDNNQHQTPATPANLPVMPQAAQSTGSLAQQPQVSPVPPTNLTEAVSMQAKSLVGQYQHDPYRLSGALQQLKAQYLTDQFHITQKSADE